MLFSLTLIAASGRPRACVASVARRRVLVFIVPAHEIHRRGFVAALGRVVEDHQRADQFLTAARIARIGVEDRAVGVLIEGTEAWQFVVGFRAGDLR